MHLYLHTFNLHIHIHHILYIGTTQPCLNSYCQAFRVSLWSCLWCKGPSSRWPSQVFRERLAASEVASITAVNVNFTLQDLSSAGKGHTFFQFTRNFALSERLYDLGGCEPLRVEQGGSVYFQQEHSEHLAFCIPQLRLFLESTCQDQSGSLPIEAWRTYATNVPTTQILFPTRQDQEIQATSLVCSCLSNFHFKLFWFISCIKGVLLPRPLLVADCTLVDGSCDSFTPRQDATVPGILPGGQILKHFQWNNPLSTSHSFGLFKW